MEGDRKAILGAGHENFIGAFRDFSRFFPNHVVEEVEGTTCIRTGLPTPEFNPVFGLGRPESLDRVAERIDHLYRRTRTPWRLVTTAESRDDYAPLIRDMGLTLERTLPGMLLEPYPVAAPAVPPGLTIREVGDVDGIREFFRTGAVAFGSPPDAFDSVVEGFASEAKAQRSPARLYVGRAEGKPAATAIRFTNHQVAGIFFVGTLPEFRRRGFGEAITWRAAMDGRREGCIASYLQASEMGRPVYERMGYRVVADYQDWVMV